MRILGAVIAGGLSTRFGSDKALAMIGDRPLIDHAIDALRPQVDAIVICGREWRGIEALVDRPARRVGPLGGLNAALQHAVRYGYDAALCVPVDVWPLPRDMCERLAGPGPAVFDRQYLVGFWPAHLAAALDEHISGGSQSCRSWMSASHARLVVEPQSLQNINRRDDIVAA